MMFKDRVDAGKLLAEKLAMYRGKQDVVVLALPRGGVVVGAEVAKALAAPLDIVVTRKIGAPGNPEYAIGALTESGEPIFNEAERVDVDTEWLKREVAKEKQEAERRIKTYRGDRPPTDLANKIVIIVDDGIATGLTMRAAIQSVRAKQSKKIAVAVPVSARDSAEIIKQEADELVVLDTPLFFGAVGAFYQIFNQTTDEEVIKLLHHPSSCL